MDLMIDIETLGVKTTAPVISIGACFFDKNGIREKFYAILDVAEQIDSGRREVDAPTIKWWMQQENAAQKVFRDDFGVVINEPRHELCISGTPHMSYFANQGILDNFATFCKQYDNAKPWGNGSNFDITILESLFGGYKVTVPWDFRNIRDLRTFKEYVYDGGMTGRSGTHHNALDDAKYQAQVVIDGTKPVNTVDTHKPTPLPLKSSFVLFLADLKARMNK